jgi:hypothetical protein
MIACALASLRLGCGKSNHHLFPRSLRQCWVTRRKVRASDLRVECGLMARFISRQQKPHRFRLIGSAKAFLTGKQCSHRIFVRAWRLFSGCLNGATRQ